MKTVRITLQILIVLALLVAPLALLPTKAKAAPVYVCLPTCEETDAHFLSIAGTGLNTLVDQPINLAFVSSATEASLEIGIFDGDTSGLWDQGSVVLEYTLYADPLNTYDQTNMVGQWLSSAMPNNAWFPISIANSPAAQSPSGNYFYYMVVRPLSTGNYMSNFKVRTNGVETLIARPFAYIASTYNLAEAQIVYPNYPDLSVTTYNGNFDFHVYVPTSGPYFVAWDGDMDFGAFDGSAVDTNDPDTLDNILPPWANAQTMLESAAGANPKDDSSGALWRRSPNIFYNVVTPRGTTYANTNPSGNMEWEQFLITTDTNVPADVYTTTLLAGGLYEIHARGVDLSNLNAWRFEHDVVGVCAVASLDQEADPCKQPLFPYTIGDTLFNDLNQDGIQNGGELGIPGVTVELLDSNGQPIYDINGQPITAVTDSNGNYSFNVPGQRTDLYTGQLIINGIYTVKVSASNFQAGGSLAGMTSTTGGEQQTNTVINQNVLTYDFGYTQYQIGDTIFNDADGSGAQNGSEAGIPNVTVELLDSNGNVIATTTTNSQGQYSFNVTPGTYTVRVAASNFAPGGVLVGMTSTTGGQTQTNTVTNTDVLTYDFGYRTQYQIGDTVFLDSNGNGSQDSGEMGIANVTVELLNTQNQVIGTATTNNLGQYSFMVFPGVYTVRVASSNFNTGGVLANTKSTTGGNTQTKTVTNANVLTYDFGYRTCTTLGDTVFKDLNGNGSQDSGEPGIANVTVELLDSNGNVIGTTTTNSSGKYSFTVLPGTYTVRIAASNFSSGKPLAGMTSTTAGGETQTRSVPSSGSNLFDFGYKLPTVFTNPGTGTIGYWKTHASAWPVSSITIGNNTYTVAQAVKNMATGSAKDKTINLFSQLVAAKLNVLIGNDSTCIAADITAADNWMKTYPYGSKVTASSAAWQLISAVFTRLDNYNNGLLCAPHRN